MSNPTAETPLLEARGIYKSFELGSQEIRVLRGVDLKMYKGEILTILGTSGVGKSTLLHILGTLERPTRGEVFYRGEAIAGWTEDRRAGLRNKAIG
ncbi:MAG: ATP-binding cassette domain-containing protein, partial [Candidatus Eisenbacteria bacterium]|nr:ATP-binding cassette domain-containing protein [Candidatus Eisenbacteria bacterium]